MKLEKKPNGTLVVPITTYISESDVDFLKDVSEKMGESAATQVLRYMVPQLTFGDATSIVFNL